MAAASLALLREPAAAVVALALLLTPMMCPRRPQSGPPEHGDAARTRPVARHEQAVALQIEVGELADLATVLPWSGPHGCRRSAQPTPWGSSIPVEERAATRCRSSHCPATADRIAVASSRSALPSTRGAGRRLRGPAGAGGRSTVPSQPLGASGASHRDSGGYRPGVRLLTTLVVYLEGTDTATPPATR